MTMLPCVAIFFLLWKECRINERMYGMHVSAWGVRVQCNTCVTHFIPYLKIVILVLLLAVRTKSCWCNCSKLREYLHLLIKAQLTYEHRVVRYPKQNKPCSPILIHCGTKLIEICWPSISRLLHPVRYKLLYATNSRCKNTSYNFASLIIAKTA